MPFTDEDRDFLGAAVEEASLDPRIYKVGAVIAKEGRILESAHGGEEGRHHAEYVAIHKCLRKDRDLTGATIYTTLEPCVQDARSPGRQPCAVEILNQPIHRVVIGVLDPYPAVRLRGAHMLQNSGVEVVLCTDPNLQERIRQLAAPFFERDWPRFKDVPTFPIDSNFTGRTEQREILTDWVSRRGEYGNLPILVLSGIGGMGKSTLTWLWSKRDIAGEEIPGVPDDSRDVQSRCKIEPGWVSPLRIIWFSFYEHEGGGDFNQFLEISISHLSGGISTAQDEIFFVDGKISHELVAREVGQLLKTQRCLVVLDGAERLLREYRGLEPALKEERPIEEVRSDPGALLCSERRVAQFLWNLAGQTSSKLLLASRLPFEDLENRAGARHVELPGLDRESAVRFLRARGIEGPTVLLAQAAEEYEYHPLSLSHLAASLLSDFEAQGDIRGRKPPETGTPLDQRRQHILARAFRNRSLQMRILLSRMAAVRGQIPPELVTILAKHDPPLPLGDLSTNLQELVRHRLIRKGAAGAFDFHPVVHRFAYLHLQGGEVHQRLADYYARLAGLGAGRTAPWSERLIPLREVVYHKARAGELEEAWTIYKEEVQEGEKYRTLYESVTFEADLALLQEFFPEGNTSREPILENFAARREVLAIVAFCLMNLGQLSEAISFFVRKTEMALEENDWQNTSNGFGNLAILYARLGRLRDSLRAARAAREYAEQVDDGDGRLRDLSFSKAAEGWALHLLGDLREATEAFEQAEAFNRQRGEGFSFLTKLGGVQHCDHLLRLGRLEDARQIAEHNLEVAKQKKWQADTSRAHRSLGDVETACGRGEEAHYHHEQAVLLARGIPFRPVLIEALLARASSVEAKRRHEAARRDLEEGLKYAVDERFAVLEIDLRLSLARLSAATQHFADVRRQINAARDQANRMAYYWGKRKVGDLERVLCTD